jgi:phosphoribosylamine-glycine ligase
MCVVKSIIYRHPVITLARRALVSRWHENHRRWHATHKRFVRVRSRIRIRTGGRVLNCVALACDLSTARALATRAADECIAFDGKQYRRDIGQRIV